MSMDRYIGTKIVRAEPMDAWTFAATVRPIAVLPSELNQPGYQVEDEDGYLSWSSQATFARAYRRITEAELALQAR
jgi:hypothetical protein